jgi:hypothetical protein
MNNIRRAAGLLLATFTFATAGCAGDLDDDDFLDEQEAQDETGEDGVATDEQEVKTLKRVRGNGGSGWEIHRSGLVRMCSTAKYVVTPNTQVDVILTLPAGTGRYGQRTRRWRRSPARMALGYGVYCTGWMDRKTLPPSASRGNPFRLQLVRGGVDFTMPWQSTFYGTIERRTFAWG